MSPPEIAIAGRKVGPAHPPYVIAEVSANHLGSLERALAIVDAAADAGADAVKLQTYTADTITIDHDGPEFLIRGGLWDGRRLHELYREAYTPWEWHEPLFARARARGLHAFSSPFDPTAVDFLARLDVPAFKIASFELVDLPLIAHAARHGKPLIISTGMASEDEIAAALETARANGAAGVCVLHCISGYPTPPEETNLRAIARLASRFGTVVGFSDHTLDSAVPVAAVALGASVLEKHLTLKRADGGPDGAFSLETDELARTVRDCRNAWRSLGSGIKRCEPSERPNLKFRRSLYAVADIAAGEALSAVNVRSIRPSLGLPPGDLPRVLGRRARRAIRRGTPLAWDLIGD